MACYAKKRARKYSSDGAGRRRQKQLSGEASEAATNDVVGLVPASNDMTRACYRSTCPQVGRISRSAYPASQPNPGTDPCLAGCRLAVAGSPATERIGRRSGKW